MRTIAKLILVASIAFAGMNCATYRMSEQKQNEIKTAPHGTLSIKIPDGKKIDGYDEKWKLEVTIDGSRVVRDEFSDAEEYSMPITAGERDVIINLRREVDRPFRSAYVYFYPQMLAKKVSVPENGTVNLTFNLPEKKFGVGVFILGIIIPVMPIFGWPAGAWPAFNAEAEPNYAVQGAAIQPADLKAPVKKKGK